jgi:hypothetical protein
VSGTYLSCVEQWFDHLPDDRREERSYGRAFSCQPAASKALNAWLALASPADPAVRDSRVPGYVRSCANRGHTLMPRSGLRPVMPRSGRRVAS